MAHERPPHTYPRKQARKAGGMPSYTPPHERTSSGYVPKRPLPKRQPSQSGQTQPDLYELMQPQSTGSESAYLKSLIDSRARVTVVLTNGERLQGRIRYYDRNCFSIGLSATGPRIFLRKDSVRYILEE